MFPDRLTEGYRAFRAGRFAAERQRYAQLAETGQRPEIMVVGCVDSRVSPEVIFDAAPGELLVVRNVANLVPPCEPHRDSKAGTSGCFSRRTVRRRLRARTEILAAYLPPCAAPSRRRFWRENRRCTA